jgi:putative endonuclease
MKDTKDNEGEDATWWLYLLECDNSKNRGSAEGTYYTGITTDVIRRFNEHLAGVGAKYTRANPPRAVLGVAAFEDRASASRAEAYVKTLKRADKLKYFASQS